MSYIDNVEVEGKIRRFVRGVHCRFYPIWYRMLSDHSEEDIYAVDQ